MTLKWATESDYTVLGEVMFDAVRNGRSQYSETQRRAWVAEPRAGEAWNERLAQQYVVIAEADSIAQGFMSLASNGYIDFASIRPTWQRTGLFRRLLEAIESRAAAIGVSRLWTHASLMAQPAFAAMSFAVVRRETVKLGGEVFDRYEMEKQLAHADS